MQALSHFIPNIFNNRLVLISCAVFFINCMGYGLQSDPPKPKKPNVIVVLLDDVGYGDLSALGNPVVETPCIDNLYTESARFTDFHVAPMCTPTRSQLLTGRHCVINGANNVSSGRSLLRPDLPVLSEVFKGNGYATGIFGKWHLGDNYPYRPQDRGFEETLWFPSSHIGSIPDVWNNDYFDDRYSHNGHLQSYSGYCTDVFFREAMKWMKEKKQQSRPFFSYVPLNAAHAPYFVPERYRQRYLDRLPQISDPDNRYGIAGFLGMIANIDENMGKLLSFLREEQLEENTILLFLSDNGTANGEKIYNAGMRGKKRSLYEGGHRVPFFIRWPGGNLNRGSDIGQNTQVQDIFPTLLELTGIDFKDSDSLEGTSLVPLLRDDTSTLPDRMSVVQFSPFIWYVDPEHTTNPKKGDALVMWNSWRLLRGQELYNIEEDSGQEQNVAEQNPEIVRKMAEYYDDWWKRASPGSEKFLPVYIGAKEENPVLQTACEWADVFMDKSTDVRKGVHRNGTWYVEVVKAGKYTLALRRWPKSVKADLVEGIPKYRAVDGTYPEGVALPIASARLSIADFDEEMTVKATTAEAHFTVELDKGRTQMKTWFYDKEGNEISGAYYVYVELKE